MEYRKEPMIEFSTLKYFIFLSGFIGFMAGHITKTEYPNTPEVVNKWEQDLLWGRSDAKGPKIINHDFGICVDIDSPGNYCIYMEADEADGFIIDTEKKEGDYL